MASKLSRYDATEASWNIYGWNINQETEEQLMVNNGENKLTAGPDQSGGTKTVRGVGSRIAPAVALLTLGDSVYAADAQPVPEPTSLGLLAAGAAVGGVVAYIRNKRRK